MKSLMWALLKVHGSGVLLSCGRNFGRGKRTFPSVIIQLTFSWVRLLDIMARGKLGRLNEILNKYIPQLKGFQL